MNKQKMPLFPLQKRGQYMVFCVIMAVVLFLSFLLAIRLGSVDLEFDTIRKILINRLTGREMYKPDWKSSTELIVWTIRTPRILTAFVGAPFFVWLITRKGDAF